MVRVTAIFTIVTLGLVAGLVISGCNGDDDDTSAPAMDLSGSWSGTISDSGDTGTGSSINFLFIQSGSTITGTASFLGPIEGTLSGRTLHLEGGDLVGYLADDNETINGTYTSTAGDPTIFTVTKQD